jgi:hypothetical protein
MIHDVRRYWKAVREQEAKLPEFVWLASGNAVTEVPARIAASLLHSGSHRIATEEEIAAQRGREVNFAKQGKRERMRRSGQAVVVLEDAPEEKPTPEPARRRRR